MLNQLRNRNLNIENRICSNPPVVILMASRENSPHYSSTFWEVVMNKLKVCDLVSWRNKSARTKMPMRWQVCEFTPSAMTISCAKLLDLLPLYLFILLPLCAFSCFCIKNLHFRVYSPKSFKESFCSSCFYFI